MDLRVRGSPHVGSEVSLSNLVLASALGYGLQNGREVMGGLFCNSARNLLPPAGLHPQHHYANSRPASSALRDLVVRTLAERVAIISSRIQGGC